MGTTGFKIINHTADTGINVQAGSLPELFAEAARGMIFVITGENIENIEFTKLKEITINGIDNEQIMVDFLTRLLYFIETEDFLPLEYISPVISENSLNMKIRGISIRKNQIKLNTGIKGVTYHQMNIRKDDGSWATDIIFDI
ncbi:MAG: archease [Vulcanimicrobiota bacterium]